VLIDEKWLSDSLINHKWQKLWYAYWYQQYPLSNPNLQTTYTARRRRGVGTWKEEDVEGKVKAAAEKDGLWALK